MKEPPAKLKKCGLCGSTRKKLSKTKCCNNWICDDEENYVLFSFARNSCARNHRKFTLCGSHHNEEHRGDWKTCEKCLSNIKIEMYVHYGTNRYNFEKLANPPKYEPTKCSACKEIIKLSEGRYSIYRDGYYCMNCGDVVSRIQKKDMEKRLMG